MGICIWGFLLTRPLRDVTVPENRNCGRVQGFLLTRPLRDVTVSMRIHRGMNEISTHTPLAGRDTAEMSRLIEGIIFLLTRPLRDVTAEITRIQPANSISTHTPLAGRDSIDRMKSIIDGISTHTPLAGRDGRAGAGRRQENDFYSHAPCGT